MGVMVVLPDPVPQRRGRVPDPEERGRTTVPPHVVARIAARAAVEAGEPKRLHRSDAVLAPPAEPVKARARVEGRVAMLRLRISVGYPKPIRQAAQEVREYVIERVRQLTGLTVRQVDIEVMRLVPERAVADRPRSPGEAAPSAGGRPASSAER